MKVHTTELGAVRWDDPELGVPWPEPPSTVSERDRAAGSWTDLRRRLDITAGSSC